MRSIFTIIRSVCRLRWSVKTENSRKFRGPRRWRQSRKKFSETKAAGGSFGVIGSNHTTNEENYYLQKFAKQVLGTPHLDHHRTGDVMTLVDSLSGKTGKLASMADLYERKAALVIGSDLALEHPLLSYQIRANYRHHQAHVYAVTPGPVREDKYSVQSVRVGGPATKNVGDLGLAAGARSRRDDDRSGQCADRRRRRDAECAASRSDGRRLDGRSGRRCSSE